MTNTQDMLGKESIGKLLLKYSVPAIIGMMVNALYNIVDKIFIGKIPGVGALAIAGVGVTTPIMTIILAFSMLVGIGAVTTISIKLGQGKRDEAERIVGNAITLSIILSVILTVIGILFADQILEAFGASEGSLVYAKAYINIVLAGCIFNIMAFVLNSMMRGDGNPKLAAATMIVGCLINIVLDAVFIFGFNMGIQGAAFATIISQAVTTFIGLAYYLGGRSNLKFKKENLKLNKSLVLAILGIGCSPFAMQLATSLVQVMSNNVLKVYGGDLAIGAMATIFSIMLMFYMPLFGLNQGMQPIIGYNYGAKNYKRAKKTFTMSLAIGTCILVLGACLIQIAPQVAIRMFSNDEKLMEIAVNGIRIYGLMLPIIGISIIGSNYMQSIGKAKIAMILSLLRQVIILIPMILILPKFFELNGVWMAQPVSDFLSTVITGIVIIKEFKSYKKVIGQDELEELEEAANL